MSKILSILTVALVMGLSVNSTTAFAGQRGSGKAYVQQNVTVQSTTPNGCGRNGCPPNRP